MVVFFFFGDRRDPTPWKMWFFEQKQGIGLGLNVSVNVRMTVIKLRGGRGVHSFIHSA